jgi:hypothetical protein
MRSENLLSLLVKSGGIESNYPLRYKSVAEPNFVTDFAFLHRLKDRYKRCRIYVTA